LTLFEEFKQSLKAIEAEEIFDLAIYRPVAFLFVKATYSTNLTPNQTSVMAMFIGVVAGVAFGFGTPVSATLGAGLFFLGNVLDCADGQIARLKKNGTKVGRIVDGFIDYVVSTAVFLGIAVGLTHMVADPSLQLYGNIFAMDPYVYVWLAALLAGLSSALQAFYFDFYRNKFLEIVYGKFYSLEDEIKEFEIEKERIKREPENAGFIDNLLITIYLKYTKLQLRSQMKKKSHTEENIPAKLYLSKNKLLLRWLSFSGSTTHITICIVCALFNKLELFLLTCILPLNILMLIVYFIQIRVHHKLLESAKS
jgi:phosphatidylglycerophosphate synthase